MAEEIKKEKFGPAAFNKETGRWHHVSASLLSKFEDCRRMPYFAKILKLPQVYTKQQKLGTENWLPWQDPITVEGYFTDGDLSFLE